MPIYRVEETKEQKAFWARVDECVAEVRTWPKWKQEMSLSFERNYSCGFADGDE